MIRDGEILAVREVVVEVTDEEEVEHETQYVLTKFGSPVTLDCTDFTENSQNWTRAGQTHHIAVKVENKGNPIELPSKSVEGASL